MRLPAYTTIDRIIEHAGVMCLGYACALVTYCVAGFVGAVPITEMTLGVSTAVYIIGIWACILFTSHGRVGRSQWIGAFGVFVLCLLCWYAAAHSIFRYTFDTSWDGQGYQSSGVLSFAAGWNPLYHSSLPLSLPDGAIFVSGYPKALWMIQAAIYLATGYFNAAKVTNLAALMIAGAYGYSLLRKLQVPWTFSLILAILVVLQQPVLMQFVSFMADGYSYLLFVVAICALGSMYLDGRVNKGIASFVMAELLLVGTKFSNLPQAGILSLVALYIVVEKMIHHRSNMHLLLVVGCIIGSSVFFVTPYLTNAISYRHIFYPTNYTEISTSVRQDNTPRNLIHADPVTLLLYGVFSRSQEKPMGKDHPDNIATLKIPFTFTPTEVRQSAAIYNNRVGAAGPIFSGIILLSVVAWLGMFWIRTDTGDPGSRIARVIAGIVCIGIIISLLNPVPNLLRYNSQVLLVPFLISLMIVTHFRQSLALNLFLYLIVGCMVFNTAVSLIAVSDQRLQETRAIEVQLAVLQKMSPVSVLPRFFYSTLVRLQEREIPYHRVSRLTCTHQDVLAYTSDTTRFCPVGAN